MRYFLREDFLVVLRGRQMEAGEQSTVKVACICQAVCIEIRIGFQACIHRVIGGNESIIACCNYSIILS